MCQRSMEEPRTSPPRPRECLPLEDDQRDRLAGEGELEPRLALLDAQRRRSVDPGELAGRLELTVLLLVGRDRRAHPLPRAVRVAVGLVDPVVLNPRLATGERQAAE